MDGPAPPPTVVDTNVLVAGLLTADPAAPTARIVDAMLAAAFPLVLSEPLLAEYRSVLNRPKLARAHRLTAMEIDVILVDLAHHAIVLSPVASHPAPDAGDQHIWDLLAARRDLRLVTGDKALLGHRAMRSRLSTPAAFADRWLGGPAKG